MPVSEPSSVDRALARWDAREPLGLDDVGQLVAEVERLRESRDGWKRGYEAKESELAALRDRASRPTPCNACGTSTDPTAACHAHSWHHAS